MKNNDDAREAERGGVGGRDGWGVKGVGALLLPCYKAKRYLTNYGNLAIRNGRYSSLLRKF